MENVNRRTAMKAAGAVAVGAGVVGAPAAGNEPQEQKLWTLEGELKVHPKYIYRYYLVLGDMNKCALYGSDHGREPAELAGRQLSARLRVRGVLGTEHHAGGTKENPSPFPPTWTLYMDVHEVEQLR